MKIHIIETGYFKLDGGAMFGVVPKTVWQRKTQPDEHNLCTWSMRCLLIEHGEHRILIDTGIGDKQDEKFRSHFEPHGEATLLGSLRQAGFEPESITDVLLTHLHFDHVGGAVKYDTDGKLVPTFPEATYWSNEVHYNWAYYPNPRERASFLQENFVPLKNAGVLKFIDVQKDDLEWLPGINIRFVYGHTEAMMVPIFYQGDHTLVYCADVIPSSFHIGMPYVMSYDLRPLDTMREKGRILEDGVDRGHYLFFEHDPSTACVEVVRNDRSRIAQGQSVDVEALFSNNNDFLTSG
ncbi:MAG: MBL fold metallo-hydrolase [Phaeodactylibacter sp.]|uniref:MBL fold metallo-hydrolase n=1 Tax=Phaeodactylibacter sp. TaxID=1940289 RepID=UPI0032EC524E